MLMAIRFWRRSNAVDQKRPQCRTLLVVLCLLATADALPGVGTSWGAVSVGWARTSKNASTFTATRFQPAPRPGWALSSFDPVVGFFRSHSHPMAGPSPRRRSASRCRFDLGIGYRPFGSRPAG